LPANQLVFIKAPLCHEATQPVDPTKGLQINLRVGPQRQTALEEPVSWQVQLN
jgi:hypothetical protein